MRIGTLLLMRHLLLLSIALALISGCGAAPANHSAMALPDSAVVIAAEADAVLALAKDGAAAVTVINVWATWCGPCRDEFPALHAAIQRHQPDARLLLYSVDFEDQASAVRAFLAERGLRDTVYLKTGDEQHFIETMHPTWSGALPATLVFDRAGHLREFWEGEADSARFERSIQAALEPHGGS